MSVQRLLAVAIAAALLPAFSPSRLPAQSISVPFVMDTLANGLTYYIRNNEDFPELFVPENLGKKVRVEVVVDTGVTTCLAKKVSHLVDYDILPNQ